MNTSVFLTGGTGFIGRHLVPRLTDLGHSVYALTRSQDRFNSLFPKTKLLYPVVGDICRIQEHTSIIRDTGIVIHLAGVTKAKSAEDYNSVNNVATGELYKIIKKDPGSISTVLHVSSLAAVGPALQASPVVLPTEPRPVSKYGRSKMLGERHAFMLRESVPTIIFRPPVVFGPHDSDVLLFFKTIVKGILPIVGNDDKLVSLIYVKDLVEAILKAKDLKTSPSNVYYPCYEDSYKWSFLGAIAAAILNKKTRRIQLPHSIVLSAGLFAGFMHRLLGRIGKFDLDTAREMTQKYWICSNETARDELGFQCSIPVESAFEETIDWYQRHGQIATTC